MAARIKKITMAEVEGVSFSLARKTMSWNEPIPEFGTRFSNVLESCLLVPFQTFAKKDLYSGLKKKGAILFYLMIKNHPFQNVNKRLAMTTLFYFLFKNSKWLRVDDKELYNFAKWVASSNPNVKKSVLLAVEEFFDKYLIDIK